MLEFLEPLFDAFRETAEAITSDTDRMLGVFIFPFIITVALTGYMFTIMLNPGSAVILSTLKTSGVCASSQPYYIWAVGGSYAGDPLAHVGMCQVAAFNPLVFIAWVLQVFIVELLAIFVFEAIWHEG
jgi:hypothetical protein